MLRQNLQQALIEIRLQILVVFHAMSMNEGLDLWIGIPRLAVDLVSADMKIGVGEKRGHFTDERVQEFVSPLASRIHDRIWSIRLDLVRTWAAGQIGISDKPGAAVARNIKLRDDANTTIARISDELAYLCLRVIKAIRSHFVQL